MDWGYQQAAARYVRRQAKQLAKQLGGVRVAEDIEFVHRARVATRRLRVSLAMFERCFAQKQVKRWRKAIRRVTTSLGDARDRDVQIELLCGTLSALDAKECFPGIARVLVQLENDRERLQRHVAKAVDRLEASGVLRQMQRATEQILDRVELSPQEIQTPEVHPDIRRHLARQLNKQLNKLFEYESSLTNSEDGANHHAMRIAAKRLRYTLEISRPMCPGRLDEVVEVIKKIQTLLGDVHDCDIWLEQLDAFAAEQRDRIAAKFGNAGRFRHLQPGIEYLQKNRQSYRLETFNELVRYWAELKGRRFWDELAGAVDFDTVS